MSHSLFLQSHPVSESGSFLELEDQIDIPTGESSFLLEQSIFASSFCLESLESELHELQTYSFPTLPHPEEDPTGKESYRAASQVINKSKFMRFPIESVLARIDGSQLILDYLGIGDKGASALADCLLVNNTITEISLIDNNISLIGAAALFEVLETRHIIRRLDLSSNSLGIPNTLGNPLPMNIFRRCLVKNLSLVNLSLKDNHLSDKDMIGIGEAIAENTSLQFLDLSHNNITFQGSLRIASALSQNSELEEINLEYNKFSLSGVLRILSDGLYANNTIKRFNLSWCGMNDECAILLGKIIADNAIEEIIASHNSIGPRGADIIAKALMSTDTLTKLVLDVNPLKDSGCLALINATSSAVNLVTLSLLGISSNPAVEKMANHFMEVSPKLTIHIVPQNHVLPL